MRVIVDRELCQSHGQCEYVAAEVFHLDDDGELVFTEDVSDDLRPKVELAAKVCPTLAITIDG